MSELLLHCPNCNAACGWLGAHWLTDRDEVPHVHEEALTDECGACHNATAAAKAGGPTMEGTA